ncbi:hypothetical protein GMRT_15605 [Giardia muris]|uniref:Uncharacterized protein n=1 Tax=Giardia muris TaxID=5742 RepID=A0A4Z1SSE0_GIAMU|nr:hypothetical protein GMRT_15605 [Giardia muris]|eukprot:TNJ28804.1 hypothetical protein GMRT_15605 [Giardia muris]
MIAYGGVRQPFGARPGPGVPQPPMQPGPYGQPPQSGPYGGAPGFGPQSSTPQYGMPYGQAQPQIPGPYGAPPVGGAPYGQPQQYPSMPVQSQQPPPISQPGFGMAPNPYGQQMGGMMGGMAPTGPMPFMPPAYEGMPKASAFGPVTGGIPFVGGEAPEPPTGSKPVSEEKLSQDLPATEEREEHPAIENHDDVQEATESTAPATASPVSTNPYASTGTTNPYSPTSH